MIWSKYFFTKKNKLYDGKKDVSDSNIWGSLSATEALVPFISEIFSDRATLAVTHSRQITPVSNMEIPLVEKSITNVKKYFDI